LNNCKVGERGDLIWKVRPVFNENGDLVNQAQLTVEFNSNGNGLYEIWEHPKKGWRDGYCISADVAEGLEQGDFNSASVLRRFPGNGETIHKFSPQVAATLHAHLKSFEYAEELAKLATYYGKAWIAVERTGLGLSTVDQLFRFYQKLYHKEVMTKGYPKRTDKLGWETTGQSKGFIITNLSRLISQNGFTDLDAGFWKETLTFVNDDGKLEAQGKSKGERCFDDRVMDRSILMWIDKELPLPTVHEEETPLRGWRARMQKDQNKKSLVGFTV
jgi:hypothetical protein